MDYLSRKELIEFYNIHLKHFGDTPQAVRWTPEGQRLRYETFLSTIGDINRRSILDFGCGKGDLYGFLSERGISCQYTGIDINENLIDLAKKKYPEVEFLALDIEEEPLRKEYDIVFICGVFNLRIADISNIMKRTLKILFSHTRDCLYLDCLSSYTLKKDIELYYVDPGELIHFTVNELSRRFLIHHGLIRDDIIMIVYK